MTVDSFDGSQDELAELAAQAAQGDRRAAGRYFQLTLPWLMGAARRIAPYVDSVEHEDMVSDAWMKLMAQWDAGNEIRGSLRSYLAQTMRNAFTDRLRSPAHRVGVIDMDGEDWSPELQVSDESAVRQAELHRESQIVRSAYASLNPDFRFVLGRALLEGVAPRQIAEELDKPSGAISNQLNRAKHALRRAVLIRHIEQAGDAVCEANAQLLPDRVKDHVEDHASGERGIAHVLGCASCKAAWGRFASMASAFGVVTLLVAGEIATGPDPATALGTEPPGPQRTRGRSRNQGRSSRAAREAARAGSDAASRAAAALASPWAAVAAVAAIAVGGAFIAAGVIAGGPAETSAVSEDPAAPGDDAASTEPPVVADEVAPVFEAWAELESAGRGVLELSFDLPGVEEWSVREVSIALPRGAALAAPPADWGCSGSSPVVCTPASWPRTGEPVRIPVAAADGAALAGDFTVSLTVFVPLSGQTVVAVAGDSFASPGEARRPTAVRAS